MIPERFEKQKKKFQEMDSHFEGFKEEIKNSHQRFDGLQLQMQQSRPAEVSTRERESGELDEIASAVGGRKTTPP